MNALKRITTKAKAIRKRHPGKSWKTAVKEAGRMYRAGKIAGAPRKRKVVRKKKSIRKHRVVRGIRRNTDRRDNKRVNVTIGSLSTSQHMTHARAKLKEEIGWLEAAKFTAPKKSSKNNLQKRINEKKRIYRKLCR